MQIAQTLSYLDVLSIIETLVLTSLAFLFAQKDFQDFLDCLEAASGLLLLA